VSKNKSAIKLNGRRYDAVTGKPFAAQAPVAHVAPSVAPAAASATSVRVHPHVADRKPARHAASHTPQRAKTLMRPAVKKPTPALKRQLRVQAQVDAPNYSPVILTAQPPVLVHVDDSKLQHAKRIPKSKFISRFGAPVRYSMRVAAVKTPQSSALDSTPTPTHSKTTAELLQHAVDTATSHEQPAPQHIKRRRWPAHAR
jgi:hypothetical protein